MCEKVCITSSEEDEISQAMDDDSIGANYSQVGDVAKIATTKQLRNNN